MKEDQELLTAKIAKKSAEYAEQEDSVLLSVLRGLSPRTLRSKALRRQP
jgi:hypothetical protein